MCTCVCAALYKPSTPERGTSSSPYTHTHTHTHTHTQPTPAERGCAQGSNTPAHCILLNCILLYHFIAEPRPGPRAQICPGPQYSCSLYISNFNFQCTTSLQSLYGQGYGSVLDSGTTFTYIPTAAFKSFADLVGKAVEKKGAVRRPGPDPQVDSKFEFSSLNSEHGRGGVCM